MTSPHHFRQPDPSHTSDQPVSEASDTPVGPTPPRPWYLQILGQWPLATVLVGVGVGVSVAGLGFWKPGSFIIGVAFLLGASLRAVLPASLVGLLEVRTRLIDVVLLTVMGVGTVVLSLVVFPGPY